MYKKYRNDGAIFLNSTLVAKIRRNDREEIQVHVLKNNKIDLRVYLAMENETEPKPTKKGIWLSFRDLPEITGTLGKLAAGGKESLELGKTEKGQIRVYSDEFRGMDLVHVRSFYLDDKGWQPGKGVSFSRPLSKEVSDALLAAKEEKS